METVWDWLSMAIFVALAVLLLQRSVADEMVDKIWHYAPPSIACAVANQLGNNEQELLAVLLLVATVIYIFLVLKPRLPSF